MNGLTLAGIAVAALVAWPSAAADRPATIDIPHVAGPFSIDGSLDEPGWAEAARTALTYEVRPGDSTTPSVQTEVYLLEDGGGLVLAFVATDPDPSQIRAYLRDRDSAYDDDWVGVVLDTFNDERRAFEFFSNPLGAQMDLINDEVNGNEDDTWDAIWDSAGQMTATGYVVEMRIPYRTLRFPATGDELTWGIDLIRRYPRDSTYQITAAARDRDISCYLCQIGKIRGMRGAEPGRNIEITPVLTASSNASTPDPLMQPLRSQGTDFEPGVDMRWGVTPNLSLSATLNPDFSQIEADSAQLDVNNQFALFYDEKRSFFLEGQDTFSTNLTVVHTRNIADPDFGLKVIGKSGADSYGAFFTNDTLTNIQIPGVLGSSLTSLVQESTAFAGRYRRDIGEGNSTVGVITTSRSSDDYYNYVLGFDAHFQLTENDDLVMQMLGSRTRYPTATAIAFAQPNDGFSDYAFRADFSHSVRNWWIDAAYLDIGDGFRADLGFISQVGYKKPVFGGGYRWYPEESSDTWWTRMQWNADVDITHDQSGQLLEREVESYFWVQGPMQSHFEVGVLDREKLFAGQLFDERWAQIYTEFTPVSGFSAGVFFRMGEQIDFANAQLGDAVLFEPWVSWNIGRHMQIRLNHYTSRLDTQAGQRIFLARLNDIRFTYQFDIRSLVRLTLQHQDVQRNQAVYASPVDSRTRNVGIQLLYSYKVNPQTVFFIGYAQSGADDDALPGIEVFDRTAFVKISYAWIP